MYMRPASQVAARATLLCNFDVHHQNYLTRMALTAVRNRRAAKNSSDGQLQLGDTHGIVHNGYGSPGQTSNQ